MRTLAGVTIVVALAVSTPGVQIKTARLKQNPLLTTRTSKSLGSNVNGPTVIRVPEWVPRPLGHYLYFANHMGGRTCPMRRPRAATLRGRSVRFETRLFSRRADAPTCSIRCAANKALRLPKSRDLDEFTAELVDPALSRSTSEQGET